MSTKISNQQHRPDFFNGIILGSFIGASLYYLYQTEAGGKTRQQLEQKAKQFLNHLDHVIDEVKTETELLAKKAHQKKSKPVKPVVPKPVSNSIPHKSTQSTQTSTQKPKKTFKKNGKKLK